MQFLKSNKFGQVSFLQLIQIVRGMHYHNQKVEKFLVLQGTGEFIYENTLTNQIDIFRLNDKILKLLKQYHKVSHSIKNIGNNTLIVLAYANEIFDEQNPEHFTIKKS